VKTEGAAADAQAFDSSVHAFDRSVERVRRLQQVERADARINPECGSIILDHGRQTRRAVVFLHGITSTPVQFRDLGQQFYERGYNVLVPRLPAHGYRDRLSRDHGELTLADYIGFTGEAVELGRGLGRHLTVAGLSVSGVLAAWCAQYSTDVDLAVLIAPAFGPLGLPYPMVPALSRVAVQLPNMFVWWDPRKREKLGPECGYPRFGTHAMAESFLLGADVYRAAKRHAPVTRSILSVTNSRDPAVSNAATRGLMRRWARHGVTNIREFRFGRRIGPLHDVIGPYQPAARVDLVYPVMLDLIDAYDPHP
jgi:pimeloyl-ACP methyl ester carboxylesterase